jgi:hypothetical protein
MAHESGSGGPRLTLRYFQAYHLFNRDQLDAVMNRSQWAAKYPEIIATWKCNDTRESGWVLLPAEIVLTLARQCECVGDLYADADGKTLYIVPHGSRPSRSYKAASGKMVVEDILDAMKMSTEQAMLEYGADAVWLAQEYGTSERGERDNRFEASPRETPIEWHRTGSGEIPYEARVGNRLWRVRINDFPAEKLYSLLVDGREIERFDDWPKAWKRPA